MENRPINKNDLQNPNISAEWQTESIQIFLPSADSQSTGRFRQDEQTSK